MNQAISDQARANGCGHRLAEMLAVRRVHIGTTDSKYLAGFGRLGDELGPEHLRQVVTQAERHGYTPQASDVYLPNMARFAGDPEAFVSPAEGRGKIERVAAKRGMVKEGRTGLAFRHGPPEQDPYETAPPLAEDIIRDRIRDVVAHNPDAARLPVKKLRQHVIDKHGPSKGKRRASVAPAKG